MSGAFVFALSVIVLAADLDSGHSMLVPQMFPALPALPVLPVLPVFRNSSPIEPTDNGCENSEERTARYDTEFKIQTCTLDNGDKTVDGDASDDTVEKVMNLFPGLLRKSSDIDNVPLIPELSLAGSQHANPFPGATLTGLGGLPNSNPGVAPNAQAQPGRAAASSARVQSSFGSTCCTTDRKWSRPTTLENIFGITRTLVHFDNRGVYQWVNEGFCTSPGSSCASGSCQTIPTTKYLAVWAFEQGQSVIAFEPFSIDNYCDCLNIGGK